MSNPIEFIVRPRGQGKTFELIKISSETGERIICRDKKTANHILRQALNAGYRIPQPLTYGDLHGHSPMMRGARSVLLDDLELYLARTQVVKISAATISTLSERSNVNRLVKATHQSITVLILCAGVILGLAGYLHPLAPAAIVVLAGVITINSKPVEHTPLTIAQRIRILFTGDTKCKPNV